MQEPPPNYPSSDAENDGELPSPFDHRLYEEGNFMKVHLDALQADVKGAFYRGLLQQEMLWDLAPNRKGPEGLDDWCAAVVIRLDENNQIVRKIELSLYARTNCLAVVREQEVQVFNRPAPPILPNYEVYLNLSPEDAYDDDDFKFQKAIKILGGKDVVERSHFIDEYLQNPKFSNYPICCKNRREHLLEPWLLSDVQSIRENGVPLWFLAEMQYFETTSKSLFGFSTKHLIKSKKFLPKPKAKSEKIPDEKIKTNLGNRECFLCSLMVMQKCFKKTKVFLPLTRTEFLFLSNPDSSFLKISRASDISTIHPLWDPPSDDETVVGTDDGDGFTKNGGKVKKVGLKKLFRANLMLTAMMMAMMSAGEVNGNATEALTTSLSCPSASAVSVLQSDYSVSGTRVIVFGPRVVNSCGPCGSTMLSLSLSSTSDQIRTLSYVANTEGALCVEVGGVKTCSITSGGVSTRAIESMEGRICYYGEGGDKTWIIILIGSLLGLALLIAIALGARKYYKSRKNRDFSKNFLGGAPGVAGDEPGGVNAFSREVDGTTLGGMSYREPPLHSDFVEGNAFSR